MDAKNLVIGIFLLITAVPMVRAGDSGMAAQIKPAWFEDALLLHTPTGVSGWQLELKGPDGSVVVRNFTEGETPSVRLEDAHGYRLREGIYQFRLSGTGPKPLTLDGAFRIDQGRMVPMTKASPIDPALHIDANRNIGIGIHLPSSRLHLADYTAPLALFLEGDAPNMVVERTATTTNNAFILMELINNGQTNIRFNNNELLTNRRWATGVDDDNRYFASASGTGAIEFLLQTNGNLTLTGTLTAPSDINLKQDLVAVNPETILAKVHQLPLTTWSFKADGDGRRHLGPMAQDFFAAFGLGTDQRYLSFTDTAGVALAATQGLYSQVIDKIEAQKIQIRARKLKIDNLKRRIEQLETRTGQPY